MQGTWTVEGHSGASGEKARYIVLLPAMLFVGVVVPIKGAGNKNDVNEIGNRKVSHRSIVSQEREIATGKQFAAEIDRSAKLINDPVITEYVNRVAQNLARNSDLTIPLIVKVIDDPAINAFALPGGFLYVNSGLLLAADEEDQLAGVMAHEIAHVAARHWASQVTRSTLLQYATLPLIFTPLSYPVYLGVSQALNFGIPLTFLKFSRSAEAEADFLGLQYMYKAGYDPSSYVVFFGKVLDQNVFAQDMPTAAGFFQKALDLDYYTQHPIGYINDDHLPGYLGITTVHTGQEYWDPNLIAKGDDILDFAVYQFPEFNNFNRWAAHLDDPRDSETYKKALDSLWQDIDARIGTQIDRNNPDMKPYLGLVTAVGRKKACWWKGDIAPYGFEGLVLNLGNGLVKAGQVDAARVMYANANYAENYSTWPYRDVLEAIAASDLNARAALYAPAANPKNAPPLNVPNRSCVYCHATVPESESH